MSEENNSGEQPIIIKKIVKGGGGHHGGAWKVAYADFVTAMMAFFLLLWLLNVTTDEQKNAISNFFDPSQPKIASNVSGAGGILGGTSVSREGAMTQNTQPIQNKRVERTHVEGTDKKSGISDEELKEEIRRREEEDFKQAEAELKQAIQDSPDLKELQKHLQIDQTPEGLRIQIIDREGEPMFPIGSARMYDKTKRLLGLVSKVIQKLPNRISVKGHTDSIPYRGDGSYTNWELSADRANASRKALIDSAVEENRLFTVAGKADTEHFIPEAPNDPRNRRVSIILLRDSIVQQALRNAGIPPSLAEPIRPESQLIDEPTLTPGRQQFP